MSLFPSIKSTVCWLLDSFLQMHSCILITSHHIRPYGRTTHILFHETLDTLSYLLISVYLQEEFSQYITLRNAKSLICPYIIYHPNSSPILSLLTKRTISERSIWFCFAQFRSYFQSKYLFIHFCDNISLKIY